MIPASDFGGLEVVDGRLTPTEAGAARLVKELREETARLRAALRSIERNSKFAADASNARAALKTINTIAATALAAPR